MRARDNPFSTDRIARFRYRPIDTTWDTLLQRLAGLKYRAAIVGPHGSGKTTLLEDLEEKLRARGHWPLRIFIDNVDAAESLPARFDPRQMVLLDGAGRLPTHAWQKLRCTPLAGLVITIHSAGLLPTLIQTRASLEILRQAIVELAGPLASELPDPAALFKRHRGNLRDCLRELYDCCAAMP